MLRANEEGEGAALVAQKDGSSSPLPAEELPALQ
ncbi:uncharacterized protein CMC5_004380 [Chondromyces crocatus]|uniref:Uncharacterized protein n=1 Tax=Chondromyces crocatus TaxID=52 RepID=A0A0K1E646_CHOCO|nr:uncharacterized protein CMC5_004380 [Chondromyces crocatus]